VLNQDNEVDQNFVNQFLIDCSSQDAVTNFIHVDKPEPRVLSQEASQKTVGAENSIESDINFSNNSDEPIIISDDDDNDLIQFQVLMYVLNLKLL